MHRWPLIHYVQCTATYHLRFAWAVQRGTHLHLPWNRATVVEMSIARAGQVLNPKLRMHLALGPEDSAVLPTSCHHRRSQEIKRYDSSPHRFMLMKPMRWMTKMLTPKKSCTADSATATGASARRPLQNVRAQATRGVQQQQESGRGARQRRSQRSLTDHGCNLPDPVFGNG